MHYLGPEAVVEPYAQLDHVTVLRLFDYGLSGIVPPEAPGRVSPESPGRTLPPAPHALLGTAPVGRG